MSFRYYDYVNEGTAYFLTSGEQYFSYIRNGNKINPFTSIIKHVWPIIQQMFSLFSF
jgi:hypothetical protein